MKLLHTSDLHIGKSLFAYSLLEEQRETLHQIAAIAKEENVDAVLIAGDVYDRAIPAAEAVTVLSEFLCELAGMGIPVCLVAGNHDSAERLQFAVPMLAKGGIHIAGNLAAGIPVVTLMDEYGPVHIHLLPFIRPQALSLQSTGEAVRKLLLEHEICQEERNVLVTHYFVTSGSTEPDRSESEQDFLLGGIDSVDSSVFNSFDYVALGHIHRPQRIGRDTIYYAGSPMKYSFSECFQNKGVILIELKEKGQIHLTKRELNYRHDLRCIRGKLADLTEAEILQQADREDYLQITLTDEQELLEPMSVLRSVYPNVCQVLFERGGTGIEAVENDQEESSSILSAEKKSDLELFREFYEKVSGRPFTDEKENVIQKLMEQLQKGDEL